MAAHSHDVQPLSKRVEALVQDGEGVAGQPTQQLVQHLLVWRGNGLAVPRQLLNPHHLLEEVSLLLLRNTVFVCGGHKEVESQMRHTRTETLTPGGATQCHKALLGPKHCNEKLSLNNCIQSEELA